MSVQEVIAGLVAARERVEQGRAKAAAAAQDFAEARALVAAALQGAAAGPLIGLIEQLQTAASEAAQRSEGARQQIESIIQQAHALGNL
jgi:hypothetical protein